MGTTIIITYILILLGVGLCVWFAMHLADREVWGVKKGWAEWEASRRVFEEVLIPDVGLGYQTKLTPTLSLVINTNPHLRRLNYRTGTTFHALVGNQLVLQGSVRNCNELDKICDVLIKQHTP